MTLFTLQAMEEMNGKEVEGAMLEISLAKPPTDKKKKEQRMREQERRLMMMRGWVANVSTTDGYDNQVCYK